MYFLINLLMTMFLFISSALAYENYNECKQFKKKLFESSNLSDLENSPIQKRIYFGIDFDFESEGNIFIKKKHPHAFQDDWDDEKLIERDIESEYLSELNGVAVSKINEESFNKELEKDKLTFKVEGNKKLYKLKKREFEQVDVGFQPNVTNISKIDSKSSSFHVSFEIQTIWSDKRFSQIAKEVYKEGNKKDKYKPENSKKEDFSYYCILDDLFFKKLSYPVPDIFPLKFSNNINLQNKVKYKFLYYPPSDCGESDCTPEEKINGKIAFVKFNYYEGVFDNEFDFSKFPFDKQNLTLKFKTYQHDDSISMPYFNQIGLDNLNSNLLDSNSPEWTFNDYNIYYAHTHNNEDDLRYPYLEVDFEIDRLSNYYVFKVMLPIVFLLLISWSVFWINPKDLESRVTVSIVCLLSLIAYNFVIDNDLPKLGYLTFMDRFILISYIFSGIPTIQTIITRYLFDNDKIELSKLFDRNSKMFVPPSYFFAILMTFIDYGINPFIA